MLFHEYPHLPKGMDLNAHTLHMPDLLSQSSCCNGESILQSGKELGIRPLPSCTLLLKFLKILIIVVLYAFTSFSLRSYPDKIHSLSSLTCLIEPCRRTTLSHIVNSCSITDLYSNGRLECYMFIIRLSFKNKKVVDTFVTKFLIVQCKGFRNCSSCNTCHLMQILSYGRIFSECGSELIVIKVVKDVLLSKVVNESIIKINLRKKGRFF